MSNDALFGHSGFVGSTLLRRMRFAATFRSTDAEAMRGRHFGRIFCAGAPAEEWIANRAPADDRSNIERLIANLNAVTCAMSVASSPIAIWTTAPSAAGSNTPSITAHWKRSESVVAV